MELSPEVLKETKEEANEEETEKVIWIKHYSSMHEILLVGEGDFSFSLSLADAFGSASNIVATSLDSLDAVVVKYAKAKGHLESLKKMGATILHRVDVMKMKCHSDLKMRKFDRIVFNFPHAGFKGKEDEMELINLHRELVQGFFKNASHMLLPYGEVHVTHKTGGPFRKWNLEELASKNSLILVERSDFKIEDYPGYNNKRGDGARCDRSFPLGECCTFKFRVGDYYSPRIGINSAFLRVYGNHLEDVCRVIPRIGPDLSYADYGNTRNVYVDKMSGALAITSCISMRGHRDLYDM